MHKSFDHTRKLPLQVLAVPILLQVLCSCYLNDTREIAVVITAPYAYLRPDKNGNDRLVIELDGENVTMNLPESLTSSNTLQFMDNPGAFVSAFRMPDDSSYTSWQFFSFCPGSNWKISLEMELTSRVNDGNDFDLTVDKTVLPATGETSASYGNPFGGKDTTTYLFTYTFGASQPEIIHVYNYDTETVPLRMTYGFADGSKNGCGYDVAAFGDSAKHFTFCAEPEPAYAGSVIPFEGGTDFLSIDSIACESIIANYSPEVTFMAYNGGRLFVTLTTPVLLAPGTRSTNATVVPGSFYGSDFFFLWDDAQNLPKRSLSKRYVIDSNQNPVIPVYNSVFVDVPAYDSSNWPGSGSRDAFKADFRIGTNWNEIAVLWLRPNASSVRVPFWALADSGDASTMSFSLRFVDSPSSTTYYVTQGGDLSEAAAYITMSPGDRLGLPADLFQMFY